MECYKKGTKYFEVQKLQKDHLRGGRCSIHNILQVSILWMVIKQIKGIQDKKEHHSDITSILQVSLFSFKELSSCRFYNEWAAVDFITRKLSEWAILLPSAAQALVEWMTGKEQE